MRMDSSRMTAKFLTLQTRGSENGPGPYRMGVAEVAN